MRGTQPTALWILLGLIAWLTACPAGARDFDEVEIQRIDLGGGLAMLVGMGGNIGVSAGPDGVFLVDDQFAPLTDKIRAAVAETSDQPIRFVLNTHWHSDHTGGNEPLGKTGAVIIAHDSVRERMSAEHVSKIWDTTVPASPHAALPVVTFPESVTLHLNEDDVHVFHVDPAHTDGDAIVHWKRANVFHMGDTFVNGSYPFVDVESGGDVDGFLAAGERVLALSNADTRIIPGHGPVAKREDLERFLAMLKAVRERIASKIAEGKSVEEVLEAGVTAEWDEEWGGGFLNPERFTRFVYLSLSAK